MEILNVITAAVAAWLFGAVWYGTLGKPWMEAVGKKPEDIDKSDKKPFIISFICLVLVAGMMRHILNITGMDSFGLGVMGGFGLGAFVATPFMVMGYAFQGRSAKLMLIDGGNIIGATTVAGIVLTLF